MLEFRSIFIAFLENYLMLAGFAGKVAVMGRDLSVQLKMRKKSLTIFSICKTFSLIIYDLPHIPIPAVNLFKEAFFR